MLSVCNLKVNYGAIQAVRNIDLEVNRGEVVMIIGANGAGKTTILNTIMGLIKPTEGEILFNGTDLLRTPAAKIIRWGISIVPEGRRLFGAMTVRENLELGAYTIAQQGKIADKLEEMFALFPRLKEREKQLAGSLSGGEQQMVAIARALMTEPQLLLMDEPSMGLAPVVMEQIYDNIGQIKARGTSILLVEQNAQMAMSVSSRGYVLQNGEVVFAGDIESFKGNPAIRDAYLGV